MRKQILFGVLALAFVSCGRQPADQVNVFNGTDFAGNTYPGPVVPFGAVQLSPDTDVNTTSGYHYSHDTILGFSHTHLSGTGCPDLGDFLVTPGLDVVKPLPFSHQDEVAEPGYYKVKFAKGITAELTATPHAGVHRYTFTGAGTRLIRIDARHCVGAWSKATECRLSLEGSEILGYRRVTGWAKDREVYLSAVFSKPFLSADEPEPGLMEFTFADDLKEVVLFAGISGVDGNGARGNRVKQTAGGQFDGLRGRAGSNWDEALGRIKVEGGPTDVFYTNFYHTFTTPNRIDDYDRRYRDQAGRNRQLPEGHHFYSTLSLWDTFRAWHPLETLLDTAFVGDMVRCMLDDYDCRGELPVWPLASDETRCMIGYHSVSVIADAWLRGVRGFDGEKALAAMVASSNKANVNASDLYRQYGWIPADRMTESVSQTLEFAYDDWCIARMAESLGHADIAAEYDRRARSYRELFDPSTGFMRGKNADGTWSAAFDPLSGSRDYTEATPWHYRFFVPHDVAGLASLMGGQEALRDALDSLFTYQPAGQGMLDAGIGGIFAQYAHGNEPGQNFPWLFSWAGAPSKTQEYVRMILTKAYSTAPDGICGNEDCGQMSAWYVLASLGLYPACPGSGEYILTAPLFRKSVIRLANGKTLTIRADNPNRPYIAGVDLNGKPVDRNWITYDEILGGGVLSFRLSARPVKERENLPAPYSLTTEPFVCPPAIQGDLVLFQDNAEVMLSCRTEGAAIRYTLDGTEPTEASPLYEEPFRVDASGVIRACAFKDGLHPSPVVSRTAHKLFYQPTTDRNGLQPGCRYTYHEANFKRISQVEPDPAEATGTMREPSIAGAPAADHFAYLFFGYIDVPEDGHWSFALNSDDGSALWIDGICVVDNDGIHDPAEAEGTIPLGKGLHFYKLVYFDDEGGQELSWSWKAPGAAAYAPVPAKILYYK
jgi:predicted alpha-1,2-mannosidase